MAKWWVYKCNSTGRGRSDLRGDWRRHFQWSKDEDSWGSSGDIEDLQMLNIGDRVVAYQSNTREIVGVVEVSRKVDSGNVYFRPLMRFVDVHIQSLKQNNTGIRSIGAFKQGVIRTLYRLSAAEAKRLLRAAAIGLQREQVDQLFRTRSLWRNIGPLRDPHPRWLARRAAAKWAQIVGLPKDAVLLRHPSGRAASARTTLQLLRQSWARKGVK